MKCRHCGSTHVLGSLCLVSRRKFFFIGGGVLGTTLAAPAVMWAPYQLPCPCNCDRKIITHSREVIEICKSSGIELFSLPELAVQTKVSNTLSPHYIEPTRPRFTGTRNWLEGLTG